ncbi:primosomal protein N' family DNA-binding protein [Glaciibacter psychrotolerans]|uniref:Probable replication restart protein PriA n=1 Tax=Glaciibacter psychrotolerans TaxID=670054 RepID=A0A7Z0J583_9MICO|nr:primosomal protein N' [Leifsonia psychrotolerans]NYJ19115.1 primosomal protein N' (replication factor Y) [Leifsonia psychrotolerans]
MRTGLVARVLVDSPLPQLDHLFDYAIPDELAAHAVPGVRVRMPLRSKGRVADGYLIEVIDPAELPAEGVIPEFSGKLSPIDSIVSTVPVLQSEIYTLARRLADRAAGNANDIIRLAVPGRQVRVEKAWVAAQESAESAVDISPTKSVASDGHVRFADYPPGVLECIVAEHSRRAIAAVPRLVRLPNGTTIGHWAMTLAELAVQTLEQGQSAIIVVPDFRDQDQVQAALDVLAPAEAVSRVDARQSNPDRYRAFLACLGAAPRIVLGNRSAVYAPARNLGLIMLWDDGDPLHGEPLSPYVHSRDAALVRQELTGCALVLLGHSRSVEAQRLVAVGWLDEVNPAKDTHPRVIPTDFQGEPDPQARAARIPTAAWLAAKAAIADGPVLVQVATPGYAPFLACQTCKKPARCTACQGPLGQKSAGSTPACRWCGALAVGWTCVHCEGHTFRVMTVGAGRTAEELGRAFPGSRVIVADGDHPIQTLGAEPALVIATRGAEPIPTGGYRAILLLDGERMLARESLRVGEDCLRWWSNAAALAAPGAPVILVGVGGALATAVNGWRPAAYAYAELTDRKLLRFPPAVRVASVVGTADDVDRALLELGELSDVDVLGPVTTDAPLVRAVVRFGYAHGDEVARVLKAHVVQNASRRRAPKGGSFRPAPTLKVRFDDPELL